LITFTGQFETLYNQLYKYLEKTKIEEEERAQLLNRIYKIILEKIKPKRFLIKEDILYLKVTPMVELNKLLKKLEDGYYNEDLQEISEKEYEEDINNAKIYAPHKNQLIYDLNNTFLGHVGYPPIGLSNINFNGKMVENVAGNIYKPNLIEENSNTNTNSNNNSSVTTYTNTKNGGYKRKTRRRLVRKQKTRSTAKNT
jgi:hypothetical protein